VVSRAEPPQLHPLPILNLLGIRITPLHGHVRVGIRVYEDIECAVSGELGEECDGGGDLTEDGGDLGLNLCFGLVCCGACCCCRVVFLVGCGSGGGGFRF
jgi:hypothetical protein